MKPITLKLPDSFRFSLAEEIAKKIHAAVVCMHLRVTEGIWPGVPYDHTWDREQRRQDIADIRALLRSIKDQYRRREFVLTVKFIFGELCKEKCTNRKWQDYVAEVKAARADSLEQSRAREQAANLQEAA